MNKTDSIKRNFGILLAVLVIISVVSTVIYFSAEPITATVTRYSYHHTKKSSNRWITVSYNINGKEYSDRKRIYFPTVKEGDRITVRVNPDTPDKAIIFSDFVYFYIGSAVIGVPMLASFIAEQKRKNSY